MSAFNQPGNVDTRYSNYYQANTTANFCLFGFFTAESRQTANNIQDNHSKELSRPTLCNGLKSQRGVAAKSCHSLDALSIINIAVGLIAQLAEKLIRRGDPSNNQLRSLNQTLTQLGIAIQVYDGRPLGQSLANTITPEVEQCVVLLRVWLHNVGKREVALIAVKRDLFCRLTSLDELLMALHS
jgi:hypothetical protein